MTPACFPMFFSSERVRDEKVQGAQVYPGKRLFMAICSGLIESKHGLLQNGMWNDIVFFSRGLPHVDNKDATEQPTKNISLVQNVCTNVDLPTAMPG